MTQLVYSAGSSSTYTVSVRSYNCAHNYESGLSQNLKKK